MRHNFLWSSILASAKGFQLFPFTLNGCPSRFKSWLSDKGTNKKTKNMSPTSFGHSIRRNQHCINLRSHLGWAASFVLNQLQKYNIRDSVSPGSFIFYLSSARPWITSHFAEIKSAEYSIPEDGRVSEDTKTIIRKLLVTDPSRRMTAGQVRESLEMIITVWKSITPPITGLDNRTFIFYQVWSLT